MNVRESGDAPSSFVRARRTSTGSHPLKGLPCSALRRRIGAGFVAKSAADGYTVMVTSASHIANAHLYKNLPFDALKDFIGITPLTVQVGILIVHPSLPAKSVRDLIALAKTHPNQIFYGSSGSGSYLHLTMAHFNVMTGTRMVHVPYKGGDAAGVALVGGELQAMIASMPIVCEVDRADRRESRLIKTDNGNDDTTLNNMRRRMVPQDARLPD